MILTGVGHKNKEKLTRTLGSMLKSDFAQKEIIPEYRAGFYNVSVVVGYCGMRNI